MSEEHIYQHTEPMQDSLEVGQSAKGDWYIKSIKLYFDHKESSRDIEARLQQLRDAAQSIMTGGG
jgi:hypothetical protein